GVIFALLNIVSLFSLFHQVYDYVLLLPLFCCALTFPPTLRAASLAYVGYIWFVFYYIDGPWMKSPAVIGATALASTAIFTLILRRTPHRLAPRQTLSQSGDFRPSERLSGAPGRFERRPWHLSFADRSVRQLDWR